MSRRWQSTVVQADKWLFARMIPMKNTRFREDFATDVQAKIILMEKLKIRLSN